MKNKTRKDEMREQCVNFHRSNPIVWQYFVRFTNMMIDRGYKNYSVNAIFERIRWEIDAGGDGVSTFKLNNNYRAFYARAFMKRYPEHDGFFRTRIQTTEEKPATDLPELTPEYFDRE
jgi:hypothetical protein|tara:strand:- start:45 stop:398 length:354 start_codon:yes stop_codon:yes gene_type:complete